MTNTILIRILGVALAALALLSLVQSRNYWRTRATAEAASHQQTVTNYRTAAAQAEAADAKNKADVEAKQRAVNERTARDYEARIADARANYERLRALTGTAPRRAGPTSVSVVPGGTPGTPGAAADHGLSLAERLVATEQAIQLDQLIRWVNEQTKANAK